MEEKVFKTEFRIRKEANEMAIYNEWIELMKQPGSQMTAVREYLTKKYKIGSQSTVRFICNRVEKRLKSDVSI